MTEDLIEAASARRRRQERASATFFVRVGGTRRNLQRTRCEHTAPLFPLWLILEADGTLAGDLQPLVERTQA